MKRKTPFILLFLWISFISQAQTTKADSLNAYILTPPSPETPRINGAKIVGVRPGSDFLFKVSASGKQPITFFAKGLPNGLSLNAKSGIITGVTKDTGTYLVKLQAKNASGNYKRDLKIVVGKTICLTPPMGWNNYNAFRMRISDTLIRRQADAMISSGLANYGWSYMNIDDGWQGTRDSLGNIRGNKKFPDMKALGDYIHSKGLKFGLYSSPGVRTCAGFEGTLGHEEQDAKTYASWGVDYFKHDWCYYDSKAQILFAEKYAEILPDSAARLKAIAAEKMPLTEIRPRNPESNKRIKELTEQYNNILKAIPLEKQKEVERSISTVPYEKFGNALRATNRDIVYSLCQYGDYNVWEWAPNVHANLWRTTRDIIPTWKRFKEIISQQKGLEKWASPGLWNDPDMLEIGNGNLTADEMYTQMSQWSILSAPLLIGTDLSKMNPFVISVLTNSEIIDINQDELGVQGKLLPGEKDKEIYVKPLSDGSIAVGLFNRTDNPAVLSATWPELGLSGKQHIRDLWRQKNLGVYQSFFETSVAAHGVVIIKISPEKGTITAR